MSKKSVGLKAASVLMCAGMVGTSIPSAVFAAEPTTEEQTSSTTMTDADTTHHHPDTDAVSIIFNGNQPITMNQTDTLESFVQKMLEFRGMSTGDKTVLLDWVGSDGMRVRLRVGNPEADSVMSVKTIADLQKLVKEKTELTLIVFTESNEMGRMELSVNDANALVVNMIDGDATKSYSVQFLPNGGVMDVNPTVMRSGGEAISYIDAKASYEHHTFDGWYDAAKDGNRVDEKTIVKGPMKVYAHWIADTHTLTFDTQGGSEVESQKVSVDETLKKFPTPEKTGHTFDGWFDAAEGGNKVTSLQMTEDTTLYAHWTAKSCSITFDADNNGAYQMTASIPYGLTYDFSNIDEPEKPGYTFEGWFTEKTGGEKVTEVVPTGDVTFYAHWKANAYQITFDANGGKAVDAKTASYGDKVSDFPVPTRDGYTFAGWFTEKDGGDKVETVTVSDNVTLYAHWSKVVTPEPEKPDNSNQNNGNGDSNNNSNSGNQNSGNDANKNDAVERYLLKVVSADKTSEVTINSDVQLSALVQKLGYSDVVSYGMKTAKTEESKIDGTVTMKEIAKLAENGDVLIIGYNAEGKAIGSAKITKTGDKSYTVSLSKDTNVSLSATNNSDGKGKGEGEKAALANTGKGDSVVASVKTADSAALPLYGGLSAVATVLMGGLAFLKKKFF